MCRQLERDHRRGINRQERIVELPSLFDEFSLFDTPQKIFDQISAGQIDAQNGMPVFRDHTGELCEVVPAIKGWIDTERHFIKAEFMAAVNCYAA